MTFEIALVFMVIGVAVFLFATELARVDVVALIMMTSLPILGLVTPREAFLGLSSNAVISIIAVIIIGAGLDRSGVMNFVADPIVKFSGASINRLIASVSGAVGVISSFMQNIGAAALFLPATMRVSKQLNVPLSKLLMPMGFCAILGGTVTLVGSSPLILLNDLLQNAGLEEFGLFSVTPIGLMLLASGIGYFLLFKRFVLPSRSGAEGQEVGGALLALEKYGGASAIVEVEVPPDFEYHGATLEKLAFRRRFLVTVVAIKRSNSEEIIIPPERSAQVLQGDSIAFIGDRSNIDKMAKFYKLRIRLSLKAFQRALASANAGRIEGIVSPNSELVGATLREKKFIRNYHIAPVALYRTNKVFRAGHADIPLRAGDALLLFGTWRSFAELKNSPDLILSASAIQEVFESEKSAKALSAFAIALALVIFRGPLGSIGIDLSLSVCLMVGALLMILLKVLSIDDAYKAIDWRTVFLLGGLLPLGLATEKSGAAAYIANAVLAGLGDVSPLILLLVIAVLATGFSLVISNVGATALLIPIAINMANGVGADPRIAAMVVAIAVSNSFILPTHQVNALLMGPGRYRTTDFMLAGAGMSVIFICVTLFGLWLFYGLSAPGAP